MNFFDPRLPARFWDKVTPEPNSGCWLWHACANKKGYGSFRAGDRTQLAHRISYRALVGPIPDGLVIDHRVCQTPSCVNPAHLEPVTGLVNTERGESGRNMRSKTHCPKGHPYTGGNVHRFASDNDGKSARRCRTCRIERARENRHSAKHQCSHSAQRGGEQET